LLGVIGEVVPRKGHIYLFRALPRIFEKFPNARLAVLGRYSREEPATRALRRFLYQHDYFRRVIWIGRRNNVSDFMAAMDVCIVPSIEEPLGLVAIEAQAAGIPVVVTDAGGLVEIVQDQVNGLVVPRKNPDAIAAAVIHVLCDRQLAASMADNGRHNVAERFSPQTLTSQVVDVLHQVSSRRAA
jgi:glycosyltransferase involved in cell wall biosynthesis